MSAQSVHTLADLLELMSRLRDPKKGCPWDLEQDFRSLIAHTVEEVYEVVDAIERADYAHLSEELGDLLFQIVFYSQLASEQGHFDFGDVVDGLVAKLLTRHPHVFPAGTLASGRGDGGDSSLDSHQAAGRDQISVQWEAIKADERRDKGQQHLLADVPKVLPALMRAQKIQQRAAKVDFDWPTLAGAMSKTQEEMSELEAAIASDDGDDIADELGDLLFCCVNLARHSNLDAETILRRATDKFEQRFTLMEKLVAARGGTLAHSDDAAKNALWEEAKARLTAL